MVRSLTQWTVADYHRMITAGLLCDRPVELLNGQIIDMAPELPIHRATYRRSSQYLASLLGERAVFLPPPPSPWGATASPNPTYALLAPSRAATTSATPGPRIFTG